MQDIIGGGVVIVIYDFILITCIYIVNSYEMNYQFKYGIHIYTMNLDEINRTLAIQIFCQDFIIQCLLR